MADSNQEGYQTLGWIVNKSEQGLFLVIADESMQQEIMGIYRQGAVEVYDYRRRPGNYAFRDLQQWVAEFPETKVFLVVNFQLALQDAESLKRLNFSRDMLEALGKNIIFLVTPYGDDLLATKAYDFYSFVKLRITFCGYPQEENLGALLVVPDLEEEPGGEIGNPRQKMAEANALLAEARDVREKAQYARSEKLLLQARQLKEKLLGAGHVEVIGIEDELAEVYLSQGRYREAEELYKKVLQITARVLGEEHPRTAVSYYNLAHVYKGQGRYREAEQLYKKSLQI